MALASWGSLFPSLGLTPKKVIVESSIRGAELATTVFILELEALLDPLGLGQGVP